MDNELQKTLVTTGCVVAVMPTLTYWLNSYTELQEKYGGKPYFSPEFRFGVSTFVLGGLFYTMIRR